MMQSEPDMAHQIIQFLQVYFNFQKQNKNNPLIGLHHEIIRSNSNNKYLLDILIQHQKSSSKPSKQTDENPQNTNSPVQQSSRRRRLADAPSKGMQKPHTGNDAAT
jgi:hypothetical protein